MYLHKVRYVPYLMVRYLEVYGSLPSLSISVSSSSSLLSSTYIPLSLSLSLSLSNSLMIGTYLGALHTYLTLSVTITTYFYCSMQYF
jgi:hypothetical protein